MEKIFAEYPRLRDNETSITDLPEHSAGEHLRVDDFLNRHGALTEEDLIEYERAFSEQSSEVIVEAKIAPSVEIEEHTYHAPYAKKHHRVSPQSFATNFVTFCVTEPASLIQSALTGNKRTFVPAKKVRKAVDYTNVKKSFQPKAENIWKFLFDPEVLNDLIESRRSKQVSASETATEPAIALETIEQTETVRTVIQLPVFLSAGSLEQLSRVYDAFMATHVTLPRLKTAAQIVIVSPFVFTIIATVFLIVDFYPQ
jgi:hypothetical protein